ncbi:TipC family immunity protein [Streptococcus rubneri]|uniref:TipC family immunity protein n=1 Tax=Streptococcus rubneri TaxID=1234680 RepID=UPI001F448475|nr:TipC family immunity protein [Streptococcus rubneri]
MKKRKFVFYSLLVVLLLSFSDFQYYRHQRIHNIFDEIYYEESDVGRYLSDIFL